MSHPFGDLLTQYRTRKHGLTQARLAQLAGYHPPVVTRMCQGKKDLTGASGRERIVRLIGVLRDERVLTTLEEANALLDAARMPPLYDGAPLEATLLRRLMPLTPVGALAPAPSRTNPNSMVSLPVPLTRFIGRERQVDELQRLLHPTPALPLRRGREACVC